MAGNGTVGRNFHHVQLVDFPKFTSFRYGSTRHPRKFAVHSKVILKRNGGKSLRHCFNLHIFLCLNSLVEPIAVTATIHNTAGLLINDHHLIVHHHILIIFFKKRIGL